MNDAEVYRKSLLDHIETVEDALNQTTVLRTILDRSWVRAVHAHFETQPVGGTYFHESVFLFFELYHVWRGAEWFEKAQSEALLGIKIEDAHAAALLGLFGFDPLVDWVPELERRLVALNGFPAKPKVIRDKLGQLRKSRHSWSFRNHLFEASVLGFFAKQGVLVDVENDHNRMDGTICLGDRDIHVEATFTSQELDDVTEHGCSSNMTTRVAQVTYKVRKKVTDGRQIAKVSNEPTLLVLGLNSRGAGSVEAQMAFYDIFRDPEYMKMSGTVICFGWKFKKAAFFENPTATVALTPSEWRKLRNWFHYPVPPVLPNAGQQPDEPDNPSAIG